VIATEAKDAVVTQGSNGTGTLEVALTNSAVSTVKLRSAIGQVFDQSADLVIGGTTIVLAFLSGASSITTAHAIGTLEVVLLAVSPVSTVTVRSAIGQVFDQSADLVVGGTTIALADLSAGGASSVTTAHAAGTLEVALTNSAVSAVTLRSAIGQVFDQSADLVVGGTTIVLDDLSAGGASSVTTAHAAGTLEVALAGSPVSTVTITSALGQVFDTTTADLVVGGTTIALAHLSGATSVSTTASSTVIVRSAVGQLFDTTADLVVGSSIAFQGTLSSATAVTTAHAAGTLTVPLSPNVMTWTITLNNPVTATEAKDTVVTQGSTATGTLEVALTSSAVSTVTVRSAIGQVFDQSADLVVGGTTIVSTELFGATSVSITAPATVSVRSAIGQAFDTTVDLVIGNMTALRATLSGVTSSTMAHTAVEGVGNRTNGATPWPAWSQEYGDVVHDRNLCTRYSVTDEWSVERSFDVWRPNATQEITDMSSTAGRPLFVYLHSAGSNSEECVEQGWVEEVVGRRGGYLVCLETDLIAPEQSFTWDTFKVAYNLESERSWKLPHVLDGVPHGDVNNLVPSQSASSGESKCDSSRHQDIWYIRNVTQGALESLNNVDPTKVYVVGTGRGADMAMVAGRCLRTNSLIEGAAMSANFSGVGRIQSGVSRYTVRQQSWTCTPHDDGVEGSSASASGPGCGAGAGAGMLNGYVGCYTDPEASTRRDLRLRISTPSNTSLVSVDWCRAACTNYLYFGIQRGDDGKHECRCGNSYGTRGIHTNQNQCEDKCPGNTNQYCGGLRTNAVYHTIIPAQADDTSVGFSFEYPISLGDVGVPETKYCHFVTQSNPSVPYAAVDYLLARAKIIRQPFMLYKMDPCLGGKWDKAYDTEMFTCLSFSNAVMDMDAMASYPSDMPDFSGSAGERTPVYPTCSRESSPASVANAASPCTPLQMRRALNHTSDIDNAYLGLPPTREAIDGTTWGWANLKAKTTRIQNGSIDTNWIMHMIVPEQEVVPTANPTDSVLYHTMDIIGLHASTTYTFATTSTNLIGTSSFGAESYPTTTAAPNLPDAPSTTPLPIGYGAYFVNLTWDDPESDGGIPINRRFVFFFFFFFFFFF
jgi:hypothetical protein